MAKQRKFVPRRILIGEADQRLIVRGLELLRAKAMDEASRAAHGHVNKGAAIEVTADYFDVAREIERLMGRLGWKRWRDGKAKEAAD